jgi:hypothetical protein
LWRREKGAAIVAGWWALIFVAANPHWVALPGTGALSNFAVFIAAYIPAGILIGAGAGWFNEIKLSHQHQASGVIRWVVLCLGLILALWGIGVREKDCRPKDYALLTRPDLRTAEWIRTNLPGDSLTLVNTFLAYSGTTAVGSDGGWWLPLLTGRATTLPPINYGMEQAIDPGLQRDIKEFTVAIKSNAIETPAFRDVLIGYGVTHLYIGQRHGLVNDSNPTFSPLILEKLYPVIYHQDGLWLFKVVAP